MGVIVKYTCKDCGVIADDVYVGPGFISINDVFVCKDCGNVMSRTIDAKSNEIVEKDSHCPNCNSTNLVIWDRVCPKCKKQALDEELVGLWD